MKPTLITLNAEKKKLLQVKKIESNSFETPFHFHDLFELNCVLKGHGKRVVGDNIDNFYDGDLVLLSARLPHVWKTDAAFSQDKKQKAKAVVLYFTPDLFLEHFTDTAFLKRIQHVFKKAERGLKISGKARQQIIPLVQQLPTAGEIDALILFLQIIKRLAATTQFEPLASGSYSNSFKESDTQRMDDVYQYLFQHYDRPVSLAEVAKVAHMTPPAFCSFFKKRTNKGLTEFINELRISQACKLLRDPARAIADICYECGYNNFAHFNKQFKKINSVTPNQYRNSVAFFDEM